MRGEGTSARVRRSIAEFKARFSCTYLFHHGDGGHAEKQNKRKGESPQAQSTSRATNDERLTTTLHHARCLLLHLLRLIMRGQSIDNRLEFPVHHLFELVNGKADAMVG